MVRRIGETRLKDQGANAVVQEVGLVQLSVRIWCQVFVSEFLSLLTIRR